MRSGWRVLVGGRWRVVEQVPSHYRLSMNSDQPHRPPSALIRVAIGWLEVVAGTFLATGGCMYGVTLPFLPGVAMLELFGLGVVLVVLPGVAMIRGGRFAWLSQLLPPLYAVALGLHVTAYDLL